MSVLIKDMAMPKSCGFCPLRHEARDGDECYLGASLTEYQKRPDDCPLVPVPPHGDLIDRDALTISTAVPLDGKPYQYVHIYNIKGAPTIISADKSNMDSFIHTFEEDGMDSFIRIFKD